MKYVIAIVIILFLTIPIHCDANEGNHFGWYKKPVSWHQDITSKSSSSSAAYSGSSSAANIYAPSSTKLEFKAATWPTIPAVMASDPLPYTGQKTTSTFAKVQPWMSKPKWIRDFLKKYPKHGEVTPAFIEDVAPTNFVYVKNEKPAGLYIGELVCQSKNEDSTPHSVWGACLEAMLDNGCTSVYLTQGDVFDGIASTQKHGGVSAVFAGIFGNLFTAGGGPSGGISNWVTRPYEHIVTVWSCYAQ